MADPLNPYSAPQSDLSFAGKSHLGDKPFGDAPIATFCQIMDAPWYQQGYSRWAKAYSSVLRESVWLLVLGGAVALLSFLGPNPGEGAIQRFIKSVWVGGVVCSPFFAGWLYTRWSVQSASLKQFRTSSEFGAICHFTIYREGIASSCPAMIVARKWSGFVSGRRFRDGILLMFDGRQFYWLPWVDLMSGKADDVDAILRANIADYKEVRS